MYGCGEEEKRRERKRERERESERERERADPFFLFYGQIDTERLLLAYQSTQFACGCLM